MDAQRQQTGDDGQPPAGMPNPESPGNAARQRMIELLAQVQEQERRN